METQIIETIAPDKILVKEAFKRMLPSEDISHTNPYGFHVGGDGALAGKKRDNLRYVIMSQADFLREYNVSSHKINSLKYYPNPITKVKVEVGEDGAESLRREEMRIYQKIKSRIAVGFQDRIVTKRLTTLIGNNMNLRIANAKSTPQQEEMLCAFREGWDVKDIEIALHDAIKADAITGDAALCFYLDNGVMGWRRLSYLDGDILYPHYDPMTGNLSMFGRLYSAVNAEGKITDYLDVWDSKYYYRYATNRDGRRRVHTQNWEMDIEPTLHGYPRIPIAYHRYGEPWWANSQDLIDSYEMSLSQLAENNKAYALRILYTLGEELELMASIDGTPQRIDSPNADAKIGYLEPADASGSFALELTTLEKNIMRSSYAVETPEIKSGSDLSSLTVKMLFADSYQKALLDSQEYQPFLNDVTELFKYGYGVEDKKISGFNVLKVKAEIYPYIFMSETEMVANLTAMVYAGAVSRQTAAEKGYEMGIGVNSEMDRIRQEEHDRLVLEQQIADAQSQLKNDVHDSRTE